MSKPKFLCDEHVDNALLRGLLRLEPTIDIIRIGRDWAPPIGTTDPDLLQFCEERGYAILTCDRDTLPGHVAAHLAVGRHTWGVFMLREGYPLPRYLDDLLLIWAASEAEEWRDRIIWLPW